MIWVVENMDSIVAGIIASLLAVSLQTISSAVSTIISSAFTQRFYYKRLFKLNTMEQTYVISGSIPQRKDKDLAFLMGPDATASINIKQTVESIYPDMLVKHHYSNGKSIGIFDENLVAVGGPVFNEATKMLMQEIPDVVSFNENDDLVFKNNAYSKCKESLQDYGLICRINNPVSPEKKAIIVAGCGSSGVLAASQLLTKSNRFKYLRKEFFKKRGFKNSFLNRDFIAVFETKMIENEVANVHVVDVLNIG